MKYMTKENRNTEDLGDNYDEIVPAMIKVVETATLEE